MKQRAYVYTGEPPACRETRTAAFVWAYQRAILASLAKRGPLTRSQVERCMEKLKVGEP